MFVDGGSPVILERRPAPVDEAALGVLASRVRPTAASRTRLLPVAGPLVPLMPDGGLRRGSVVHCSGEGALSLMLAMVGAASAAGSWCGLVGVDDLGALAAAGYGIDLRRLAVVCAPGAQWAVAAARLLEGLDVVAVEPPSRARPQAVRSLVARARRQGAVLVAVGPQSAWPDPADLHLQVRNQRWCGLDRGAGRLVDRRVTVEARGRGVASRPVACDLWLPTAAGQVATRRTTGHRTGREVGPVERLLLIDCPELADPGDVTGPDGGHHLRELARLVDALVGVCPWVDPVRPGVCTLAVRGPARYFGGEAAVLDAVAETVVSVLGESPCHLGVAEGVFAAGLAARVGAVVPSGATAAFLSPWPVAVLGTPELGELLPRLGLGTLGALGALPAGDVLARFGSAGARCQRVARGLEGELPGCRTPGLMARLRTLQVGVPLRNLQPGFWGGAGAGDERAAEALTALQRQLGPEAVVVAVEEGGRGPDDRVRFVTWSADAPPANDGGRGAPPWPGRLPPPSPSRVASGGRAARVELVDAEGDAVGVSGRGLLTAPPARVSVDGGAWTGVTGWSAPWPAEERWWSRAARRSVRLQVTTADGKAHLLEVARGTWRSAATYD